MRMSRGLRRIARLWVLWAILGALAVVSLILWAALAEPPWLLDTTGLHGSELAKARNDFRGTMLTALGGLAVLSGAAVAAANLAVTQRIQWRAQVGERFSEAIDQLGNSEPGGLDVRVGAIFAL